MSTLGIMLVSCCLEGTRKDTLEQVVDALIQQDPTTTMSIDVFDNASTVPETDVILKRFEHVYRSSRNVGYWSAIDWWLEKQASGGNPPKYVYIIESDMVHYGFQRLRTCVDFLEAYPQVGGVRVHEYLVAERHLYDKDHPVKGSKRWAWRTHTNRVTDKQVSLEQCEVPFQDVYLTNFLTHLPAVNRFDVLRSVFLELRKLKSFTEFDFQRLYHAQYPTIGILDGGVFHDRLGAFDVKTVTGSWPTPEQQRLGYQNTRHASIVPIDQYTVAPLA